MPQGTSSEPADPRGEPVEAAETGFGVGAGELRIDDDAFELDFSAEEGFIAREAINYSDDAPDALAQQAQVRKDHAHGWKGNTLRGDYAALKLVRDALKEYEEEAAGIGEDKLAYDARTALNHAERAVREATGGNTGVEA